MRHIHIYQLLFFYEEPISHETFYIYKCLYCHKKIAYLGDLVYDYRSDYGVIY